MNSHRTKEMDLYFRGVSPISFDSLDSLYINNAVWAMDHLNSINAY